MENLNLLFYKTFYSKLGDDTLVEKNLTAFEKDIIKKSGRLVSSKFYEKDYKAVCSSMELDRFLLKTAYPGLLAGTGYAHGVDADDDIKVGFSFDYVTGQPYIPGSSVKGLLRSYFARPEVIRCFLKDEELDVKALEKNIFGTNDEASDDGVDTFFDAVIRRGDEKGRVMAFDAITPHGEDLTKNPTPIKILKVMPDVVFEFSFRFEDSDIEGKIITAEQKKNLFEKLLTTFGIGAKTNVGYGVLTEFPEKDLEAYTWPDRNATVAHSVAASRRENQPVEVAAINGNEKPVQGEAYNCTVDNVVNFGIFVKIEGTCYSGLIHISKLGVPRGEDINGYFKKGQKVVARFIGTNDKGQLSFGLVR